MRRLDLGSGSRTEARRSSDRAKPRQRRQVAGWWERPEETRSCRDPATMLPVPGAARTPWQRLGALNAEVDETSAPNRARPAAATPPPRAERREPTLLPPPP